ncbi:MAG: ABC transporter ATP-binding protein [Planctomycetia bacterium]|nr:ABC transporter ATP-binding protein [Planctomycetia bacterium]
MTDENSALPTGEGQTPLTYDVAGIDGAAIILGQLLLDTGDPIDRGRLRRVVREAADAFPGDASQLWWHWIGEAGTNLGLKCKVVDCTPDEFRDLARDGARLVLYVPGSAPWRAVTDARGRKVRLARAFPEHSSQWCNASDLREFTGNPGTQDMLRCVIVERSVAYGDAVSLHAEKMSPPARLWALLRPERSDIFVLLVFSFIVGLLALATPIAFQSMVDTVAFGRFLQPLVVLTLLLLTFMSFSAAIQGLESYVVEIIQCRLFARVTADLAYRLPRVRAESQDGKYMPELVNRFFDIVTVQKVTAKLLLDGLTLVLNTVIGMVVLALYHPWLLGLDVVLLAMLAFVVFILGRGAVTTSIKESKYKYAIAAWLQDLARCAVTFKYDGGAEYALERADHVVSEYLSARKKHYRVLMRQILFSLSIHAVASAVLLGIGGWLVMTGELTLGQLVAAELIVTVIVASFAKLGGYLESYYDLLASVDKLGVLLDLPIEEQEGLLHRFPAQPASLTVRGVDYSLSGGVRVLESIRLEIGSGERVALMGSGKSVLLDLIFGLRTPTHGHLLLDGINPRDLRPDFLRRRVALVRDVEVFQGSVAENVHLGRPEVTLINVRDALEQVGLLEGVLRLPEGIDTDLTSAGEPLTENQLRRLMLARAIVSRPGLLLVDGVLDTLPDEEAVELMGALCDSRRPWTLLTVTGRASLQKQCSRVIELQHGESRRDVSAGADQIEGEK